MIDRTGEQSLVYDCDAFGVDLPSCRVSYFERAAAKQTNTMALVFLATSASLITRRTRSFALISGIELVLFAVSLCV